MAKGRIRRAARAARSVGGRAARRAARNVTSAREIREKSRVKTLALGGVSALGFGLLQSKVNVPGIPGLPDSLTYGTAGLALGLLTNSETLINVATGPFFAGLHNVALHGVGSDAVGYDDSAQPPQLSEGRESLQGEFEDVVSGDFDDL